MNQRDNNFFEAYKRLDRLCGDILNCKNGINEYIQQMEESNQLRYKVSEWTEDYKMLKHIRWVRNQIAHDISNSPVSTEADLKFTNSFYNRIINQNDPFARLRNVEQRKIHPHNYSLPQSTENSSHTQSHNNSAIVLLMAISVMILLISLILFFYLVFNN